MVHVEVYVWSYCPYCQRAEAILEEKGVDYERHVLDDDDKALNALKKRTGHQTVPQIFFDDDFIGGCEELSDLDDRGELNALLGIDDDEFEYDEDEEEED